MAKYQEFCPKNMPKIERKRYNVGDIFENKAKCLDCGDIVMSENRHDYRTCKCGNLSVDGGSQYLKRCFTVSDNSYEELSTYYDDVELN